MGICTWFTGLSGSGKTTLAKRLPGVHLDGDILRKHVCKDLGFSERGREENIRRVIIIAEYLLGEGNDVVCSFITPYNHMQQTVRKALGARLVYVRCPVEVCIERDPKGLYKKNLPNFTGVTAPYEEPINPDLILDTSKLSIRECVCLLRKLK